MLMTGNLRAWRHMIEQRANRFADAEICRVAMLCFEKLRELEPMLWEDYTVEMVRGMIGEELAKVKATVSAQGEDTATYDQAAVIFDKMSLTPEYPEFLTLPLYEAMA